MGDQAELRCQHHLIASALQGAGDEFFVSVGPIDLCGVDQRDAEIDGAMDRADGLGVVGAGAGIGHGHAHRAQTEASNFQFGEMSPFHGPIVRRATSVHGTGTVARVHRIDAPAI